MAELDIGCGKEKHPGAVGLDMNPGINPDVVFEIALGKLLPFPDNYFDRIWMQDILEHVDNVSWLLSEAHRVAKPNALILVRYPHFSSTNNFNDVTHVRRLGIRALEHFDPTREYGKKYSYYTFFNRNFPLVIQNVNLDFTSGRTRGLAKRVYSHFGSDRFERWFASFFPIGNVDVDLMALKA
ncbi:class I SAM-dependent methyltransferase [Candidatus Pacearchaeota archaeon]|nr:class I SAM-dependent methyltransferase [Candidatus Pacearchaeota archaeon]